jgi:hypothetical protein
MQKEAYANFFACTYLQSLFRDRSFPIRTDHRNLLYIKNHSNPMIIRWLMALSEFSFKIEFIPGVNNDIAESMSRLRNTHLKPSCLPILLKNSNSFVNSTIPLVKYTTHKLVILVLSAL